MKRKLLSLMTVIGILMGTVSDMPVSASYNADADTGTYIWDFAEFTGDNIKVGQSGIQTYEYEGLTINIGNINDRINTTGVVWSGGGGVGESNRHIEYTPTQDGTLYVTGTMSTSSQRWGITDSTGSLIGDSSSTTSTSEAIVTRELTAKQTYYIYARNSAKLTVSNVRYVTASGTIETPDPNATEEPSDPTPNPEDMMMSIVEDATGNSTEVDTYLLYRDTNVTQFAVTTADDNGKIISQSKVAAANSVTVDTEGAAKVEIVPVFRYNNIGSVQTEKTLRTEVENGLYNFTFKKGGVKRADIYVNGAMVANNVDKDGYNRNTISDGSEVSVNDIAITDNSVRVQIQDTGNSAAYNMTWCEFYKAPSIADRVKKVYVIGDSLVANYYGTPKSSINIAQAGWGQVIGNYFTDAVEAVNLANGGHYATILETTAFPGVIANAKSGDYLIIESGYNDTKHNTADETRESVERMVTAAKAKGIIPVVVSPNASMEDEGVSNYVESIRYTEAMRQAAQNTSAYFVDLSKGSYDFYRENYGDDTDAIKNTYYFPTEKTPDLLHHNYLGAMNCARIVTQGMYDLGIKDFINTDFEFSYTDAAENEITLKIDTTKTDNPTPSDDPTPSDEPTPSDDPTPSEKPTPSDNPTEGIKATVNQSDGKYTVKAEAGSKQGIMIAASYKNGALTAIGTTDYTGQQVNIDLSPADGADRVKVMLWKDLNGMEPIYPAKELEVESAQPTNPTDIIDEPEPLENEAEVMNLAGEWGLKLASYSDGITTDDTCTLPGTLSENSKGKQNNSTDKTKLSLKYTYTGDATYQKKITIPAEWEDKSVTLSMERTKLTRVWVNGVEETDYNTSNSIAVPHEYYLKNLVPGQENTITVQVTNGTGSNEDKSDNVYGLFRSKTHMLTAETQTDWNGIIGEVELKATDEIYIKDVMVYPDVKNSQAKVKVVVQNDTAAAASGKITLAAESYNHSGAADTVAPMVNNSNFAVGESTLEFTYNMGDNPKLWSEFHPALYHMAVSLEAGSIKSDYSESFGMRDWGTKEGQFTINGSKTFLRGEANSAVFPENGYPYMTKAEWMTFFKKAQSMGINFFRFHSWIPPMAAFDAADELGIYMQPEMYGFGGTPTDNDFNNTLYGQDGINAVKYLASNPSFVMMTFGNEMNTTSAPVEAFRAKIKAVDPTRLYAEGTNNNLSKSEINANDDFWTTAKVGLNGHDQQIRLSFAWNNDAEGGRLEGEQPNSAQTFDKAIAYLNSDTPVMGHETGQYQVLPKFDQEIARYDNTVFAPRNLSNFKSIMNNKGLLYMNDKFSEATARTSAIQYRADIEAAIKTNGFGGYQLLSIQDFPGQNTALVGILDSFMQDKDGGFTSEEYKSFNSPVTTLAKIPKYMYNTTDAFIAEAVIANYSESAINGIAARWSIKDDKGAVIKEGTLGSVNAPQGQVTSLGEVNEAAAFAGITKAQKLTFTVSAADSENSYSLWVYPEKIETKPEDLLIAGAYTKEVRDTLEAGGKVLMIPTPDTTNLPNSVSVRWTNDYWSSMFHGRVAGAATTMGLYMDAANPVFNDFPTESFSDYQWYNLMKNSRAVILDDAGSDFEPIVWNIDHMAYSRKLGSIFEAKVGDGKLLVCTMDVLNQMKNYPEVRQMYNSLVEYASSDSFNPSKTLTTDYLKTIFKPVINSSGTVSAYEEIGGLEYSWSETKSAPKSQTGTDEDGDSVTNAAGGISAGDMLRYDNVSFSGNGSTKMIVSAANDGNSGDDAIIEVYSGSENGEKIATLNFANTGGWDKFKTQEFTIPHMWGKKNILLKFTNANICLDYIVFEESSETYRDPYTLIDPSNTSSGAIEITDIGGTHSLEQLTAQVNGAVRFTIPNCDFGFIGSTAVKIGGSVLSGNEAKVDVVYTENGEEKRIPITFKMGEGEEYTLESGTTGGLTFWRNTITLPSAICGVQDIKLEFAADANLHFSDITFVDDATVTKVWDFSEYTTEVNTTESGFAEEYNGLKIAIANNGAESDHDSITTNGVYWHGGASSGESTRYIEYTPKVNGTLEVTGKIARSDGRWGISTSKTVSTLKDDGSSSTSTSEATVSMQCDEGKTYYIINKSRAVNIYGIQYIPD